MDSSTLLPIHDLMISDLPVVEGSGEARWDALKFEDHLLREMALVQVIQAAADKLDEIIARSTQSEVWVLLDGSCQFAFRDTRSESPTHRAVYHLTRHQPTRIFIPAGVAFGFRVLSGPAQLIRISDSPQEPGDSGEHVLPWPMDS